MAITSYNLQLYDAFETIDALDQIMQIDAFDPVIYWIGKDVYVL